MPVTRLPSCRSTNRTPRWSARARTINKILAATYPDAHIELDFTTPLELLVATILSAQSTDRRVNLVTPIVFARYPDAAAYAAADRAEWKSSSSPPASFASRPTR